MDTKLFLTISAIIAILYGVGFVLIPAKMVELNGVPPEPHAILNLQFFGRQAEPCWCTIGRIEAKSYPIKIRFP